MGAESNIQIGRRRDSRLRVGMGARLILLTGETRVGLNDLSQSGARFRAISPVKLGAEGVLIWLDYEAFGTIMWARNGFAGMEFDEPIDERILLETRERADLGVIKTEEQIDRQLAKDWFLGYS